MRWGFVSSENSTGFHSPRESARTLAESIDLARQAELKAWQIKNQRKKATLAPASQRKTLAEMGDLQ